MIKTTNLMVIMRLSLLLGLNNKYIPKLAEVLNHAVTPLIKGCGLASVYAIAIHNLCLAASWLIE